MLVDGSYSFIFFSPTVPPHIHVRRDRQLVKFWLEHIGVEGLLAGRRSAEKPESLERWLATRR